MNTVAFGFIGVFIGPPMLAVGLTLLQLWSAQPAVYGAKPATVESLPKDSTQRAA